MDQLQERDDALDEKIADSNLSKSVDTLVKDAKRSKRNQKILAISIALDLFLTVVLGVVSYTTTNLVSRAETTEASIRKNCEVSNEARSNNKQLWEFILNLPSNEPPPTPEQQKNIDDFKVFLNDTFAPRDCSKPTQD